MVNLEHFLAADETHQGFEVVGLAVSGEGFGVGEEGEHDDPQGPDVDGWGDMAGHEQLLRRVVANSALPLVAVVAGEVEARHVPVDELHLVETESGADRVDHNIPQFHVVMDYARLVGTLQLLQDLIENQGSLMPVELELADDDGLFVREDGHGVELLRLGLTFIGPTILGPGDRVVQFLHDVVLPPELSGLLFEISFNNLPVPSLLIFNQINLP